jgi:hypothetical protein
MHCLLTSQAQGGAALAALLASTPSELGLHVLKLDGALSDVRVDQLLDSGASGRVYRVTIAGDDAVLKSFGKAEECRDERDILRHVESNDVPFVPRVLAAAETQLVLAPRGLSVTRDQPWITRQHALGFIETVGRLHECGVLHRDIRPENLVVYIRSSRIAGPRPRDTVTAGVAAPTAAAAAGSCEISPPGVPVSPPRKAKPPQLDPARHSHRYADGLYLIDFAFAERAEAAGALLTFRGPFRGALRYASDAVLEQLQTKNGLDLLYTADDEWHSVIRTLYGISHPKVHRYLCQLPRGDVGAMRHCWDACLAEVWDARSLTGRALYDRAQALARSEFPDFVPG